MFKSLALATTAMLFASAGPALAQDTGDGASSSDRRVRVGLGVQTRPEYIGADKNNFLPLLDFSMKRGPEPFDFEAPDDNFDIALFKSEGFSAGPVAAYQSGRKRKDVGADVDKLKGTIEVGGFAQYELGTGTRLRLEVRQGLGGHKGLVGQLGADQVWRDGDKWQFSVGPRVLASNGRFMRSWFGVDDDVALATGLDEFEPDGGIHAVGLTSGVYYSFGGAFGMFGYARGERLVGDAADSPIVKEFGSKTQLSAGLGLTYTFNLND
jgi:outer membrane protein